MADGWLQKNACGPIRHAQSRAGRAAGCTALFGGCLLLAVGGCGVNATDLALQSGNSAANTVFDLLLTTFANQVADAFDQANRPPAGNDGMGSNDGSSGGDGSGDMGSGDATAGADRYASNCMGCHGDPGMNNGAVGPDLQGVSTSMIRSMFDAGGIHAGFSDFSDADIADLAAFLSQ